MRFWLPVLLALASCADGSPRFDGGSEDVGEALDTQATDAGFEDAAEDLGPGDGGLPDTGCAPSSSPNLTVIACHQAWPWSLVLVGEQVFWLTQYGQLMRVSAIGAEPEQLLWRHTAPNSHLPFSLLARDHVLFWIEQRAREVVRFEVDTRSLTVLAATQHTPVDLAMDDTHLYWTEVNSESVGGAIRRVPQTGGSVQTLLPNRFGAQQLTLHLDRVFWVESSFWTGTSTTNLCLLRSADKASGRAEVVHAEFLCNWIGGLTAAEDAIYWSASVCQFPPRCGRGLCCRGDVYRLDLRADTFAAVVSAPNDRMREVLVSDERIYYGFDRGVGMAHLDGSSTATIARAGQPSGLASADGFLYFTDPRIFTDVVNADGLVLRLALP